MYSIMRKPHHFIERKHSSDLLFFLLKTKLTSYTLLFCLIGSRISKHVTLKQEFINSHHINKNLIGLLCEILLHIIPPNLLFSRRPIDYAHHCETRLRYFTSSNSFFISAILKPNFRLSSRCHFKSMPENNLNTGNEITVTMRNRSGIFISGTSIRAYVRNA